MAQQSKMLSPSTYPEGVQGPQVVTPKYVDDETYTLQSGDDWVIFTSDNPITVIIPKAPTEGFQPMLPAGSGPVITLTPNGAGTITVQPEDGDVTILSLGGALSSAGQYGVMGLAKEDINVWKLFGNIV